MALKLPHLLAGFCILDTDRVIVRSRGDSATVRGEGYRLNLIAMALKLPHLFAGLCILDTDRFIARSKGDSATVRGEDYRPN